MNATRTLGLAFALSIAALAAACGPPPPAQDPTAGASSATPAASGVPSATPAATPSGSPSSGAAVTPPTASGTPATGPAPAAGAPSGNTPVGASKFVDDVKKATGIDLKKAPDLEKLGASEKKKLMPFFVKSLGYDGCSGCHVEGDFKQVTRNMKITRGMWKNFVVALRDQKGGAVFCDSCHQGKAKNLARADKKAVEKFMESDYVGKFTRADKKESACTSCHGDEMELKIIEKSWKIAAK